MTNFFLDASQLTSQGTDKLLDEAERILDATHLLFKMKARVKEINVALQSEDRVFCFAVLQTELEKNKQLINSTTPLTGIGVLEFPMEILNSKGIAEIKQQLKLVKFVIAAKIIAEHNMQKLLKNLIKSVIEENSRGI